MAAELVRPHVLVDLAEVESPPGLRPAPETPDFASTMTVRLHEAGRDEREEREDAAVG